MTPQGRDAEAQPFLARARAALGDGQTEP